MRFILRFVSHIIYCRVILFLSDNNLSLVVVVTSCVIDSSAQQNVYFLSILDNVFCCVNGYTERHLIVINNPPCISQATATSNRT